MIQRHDDKATKPFTRFMCHTSYILLGSEMMKECCIMIQRHDSKATKPFTRFLCDKRPTNCLDQQ